MTSGLEMKGIYSQKKRQVREEISKKKDPGSCMGCKTERTKI